MLILINILIQDMKLDLILVQIPNFDWGENVIIFGADMSSSVHANNKNKDILILGKGQTQGSDSNTLTSEAEYS